MAWKLFRSRPEGAPAHDKFALAVRQRRMGTAQLRVDAFAGFSELERRWCDPWTAAELDGRLAALGDPGHDRRSWPDRESLASALRVAAAAVAAAPAHATVLDEPEARWVEAQLRDLLEAVASALTGLRVGAVVLGAEDRVFRLDVHAVDAGAEFRTALQGDWPAEVVAALS